MIQPTAPAGTFDGSHWARLQETFAGGSPILVLGPGCHRIAYDKTEAWSEITRRVRLLADALVAEDESGEQAAQIDRQREFLEGLWRSRLSDETRAQLAGAPLPERLRVLGKRRTGATDTDRIEDALAIDRIRTRLAVPLLRALSECTRCLGSVVAAGATPVLSWHEVSHAGPSEPIQDSESDGDGDVDSADLARVAAIARRRAGTELGRVVTLAAAMTSWHGPASLGETTLAEIEALDIGVDIGALRAGSRAERAQLRNLTLETLKILDIEAIEASIRHLAGRCFASDPQEPISGAMIEWLSDLLWHVLSSDSAVPPSQAELTFYLNLRAAATPSPTHRRAFTRTHAGEYRRKEDVTAPVKRLLSTYDVGLRPEPYDFDTDERARFARTIAATLLTMWEREREQQLPVRGQDISSARPIIALASQYDLMLERQLMDSIEGPDQGFHVIVPMWARQPEQARHLVWLFGTYVKHKALTAFKPSHLTSYDMNLPLTWTWYDADTTTVPPRFIGPIIIKTNGSPLLDLGLPRVQPEALGLNENPRLDSDAPVQLEVATLYSEYDSLASIITFAGGTSKLAQKVNNGLSWDDRSWLFFGDSFPDWIPRLRLLYSAQSTLITVRRGGVKRPKAGDPPQVAFHRRIAVDRDFDWPEVALMSALDVDACKGDLVYVAGYPDAYTGTEAIGDFLASVREKQPW